MDSHLTLYVLPTQAAAADDLLSDDQARHGRHRQSCAWPESDHPWVTERQCVRCQEYVGSCKLIFLRGVRSWGITLLQEPNQGLRIAQVREGHKIIICTHVFLPSTQLSHPAGTLCAAGNVSDHTSISLCPRKYQQLDGVCWRGGQARRPSLAAAAHGRRVPGKIFTFVFVMVVHQVHWVGTNFCMVEAVVVMWDKLPCQLDERSNDKRSESSMCFDGCVSRRAIAGAHSRSWRPAEAAMYSESPKAERHANLEAVFVAGSPLTSALLPRRYGIISFGE